MMLLDGKVALITGAGGGLGGAQARHFASEGARLVVTDIDLASAERTAEACGDSAFAWNHDVASASDCGRVTSEAARRFGRIDILVNNAAAFTVGSVEECSEHDLVRLFQIDVTSVLIGIQAVTPIMKRQGSGAIINIASVGGMRGMPELAAYSTSKWALRGLTRCAAADLAPHGIRVNSVCPGVINTSFTHSVAGFDATIAPPPIGRVGTPDDIAPMVALLASDNSGFATGAEFVVDGGRGI